MSKKLSFSIAVNLLTENFKKGAKSVTNSFKSMQLQVMAFAGALGFGGLGLMSMISQFKDITRETSRVLTALKNVSGATSSFNTNLSYLNGLAKKYGLEVNSLISNFTSFTASATQANMPLAEQQKIFEAVSRASSSFALSAQQTDGVFLALTQMMGKGKISMQELRNQMGEKLPIAMQAMANAMGVSIGQLDKMISSGQVMAKDVLPKFADELNKLTQNVDTDNLEASLNRLSNTFGDVVMNAGFESKYKTFIDWLNSALETLGDNTKNVFIGLLAVIGFTLGKTFDKMRMQSSSLKAKLEADAEKTANKLWAINRNVTEQEAKLELLKQQQATATAKHKIQLANQIQKEEKRLGDLTLQEQQERARAVTARYNRIVATQTSGLAKIGLAMKATFTQIGTAIKGMVVSSGIGLLIALLTTIVYKIYEYATAVKKADEAVKEYNVESTKQERELNAIFKAYKLANEGTKEKAKLLDTIKSKYGDYIQDLIDEKGRITDIELAQRQANKALKEATALRIKDKALDDLYGEKLKSRGQSLLDLRKIFVDQTGSEDVANEMISHIGELFNTKNSKEASQEANQYIKESGVKFHAKQSGFLTKDVSWLMRNIKENAEELEAGTKDVENAMRGLIGDAKHTLDIYMPDDTKKVEPAKNKEYWEKQKQDATTALGQLLPTDKDFEKQRKLIKEAEKELKAWDVSDKTPNNKEADKLKKQLEEKRALQRESEKAELEHQQKMLDLEEDSYTKRQAQIDLNFKKEMQDITHYREDKKRQQEESLKTNGVIDPLLSDTSIDAEAKRKTDVANANKLKANQQLYKELLEQNLNYQQQIDKIEKEYTDKKTQLNKVRADIGEDSYIKVIEELTKKKDKEVSSIKLADFQDSINWEQIFGNLDRLTTESLQGVREKLQTYINELGSSLSPQDAKVLTDAIEQMNVELADRSPIEEAKKSYEEYRNAVQSVADAKRELNRLEEGTDEYQKALDKKTKAENDRRSALTNMTKSVNSVGSKGRELVNSGNEIIGMLEDFGISVDESVTKTLQGVGQIMSGLESIDLTKPFSVITSSITMITGAGKTIAGIFGMFGGDKDTKRYNEMKAQYDSLNKVWDQLISKKKEYIAESYGEEAKKVGEEAKKLTEKQIEANKELGKAYMNSKKNKSGNSWGVRQQSRIDSSDWRDLAQWKRENNISDELYRSATTGRMEGLFDLSAEQLESLKETAPKLWAKLEDQTKEYLDNIIAGGKALEEITKITKEQWTQISFDSFRNSFADLLLDMDSSSQDFADNFEKHIQKAILNSLVGSKYKTQLQALYDEWAEASKSGTMTPEKAEELRKKQQQISDNMLADKDKLKETFDWKSDSKKQQSSTGYSTSMDQETGGAILGRVTAVNENGLNILATIKGFVTSVVSQMPNLAIINQSLMKSTEILGEMKEMQRKIFYKIESIDEKLGKMTNIQDSINQIKRNTDKL